MKTNWNYFWWIGYPMINLVSALIHIGIIKSIVDFRIREQRDDYDFGDSLNYITYFGPVLLVCVALSLAFAGVTIYEFLVNRQWKRAVLLVVVGLIWTFSFELGHYMSNIPDNI